MLDVLSCVCLTLTADRSRWAANKSGNITRETHIKQLRRCNPKKMRVFHWPFSKTASATGRDPPSKTGLVGRFISITRAGDHGTPRPSCGSDHGWTTRACSAPRMQTERGTGAKKRDHTRLGQIASGTDRGTPGGVGREMCLT